MSPARPRLSLAAAVLAVAAVSAFAYGSGLPVAGTAILLGVMAAAVLLLVRAIKAANIRNDVPHNPDHSRGDR